MRIAISGDVLRPYDHGGNAAKQNGNIRWLHTIVGWAIAEAVGAPVEPILGQPEHFSLWDAYSRFDRECSVRSWAALYHAEPTPAFLDYVQAIYGDADFVVLFEGNQLLLRSLDLLGIPFIDVVLHPVRFLEDVVLGFRSSDPDVQHRLTEFAIAEEMFFREAALLRGGLMKDTIGIPKDVRVVFFGQTADDKVLIHDGALVNLATAPLPYDTRRFQTFERAGFKPHPFNHDDFGIFARVPFHRVVPVEENFYRIVSSDQIAEIVSVTSSVSVEARYFGKRGTHLGRFPYEFWPGSQGGGAYVPLAHEYLHVAFWQRLFAGHLPGGAVPRGFLGPSKIRLSLRSFWGFNEVTQRVAAGIA